MDELREMLSYCRPASSSMEEQFIKKFIDPLNPSEDGYGNRILTIGDSPTVMFACHTDTVHHQGLRQKIRVNKNGDFYAASKHSNCLGADDTTGVWLCIQLARLGIPGVYVFHRGEEIGCMGAKYIVRHNSELLESVQSCIEFDRMGYDSIITHQSMGRCASDEFASALAKELGMGHNLDTGGIWTDNVEYVDIIPECTNLSVGYFAQHSPSERQNMKYVKKLLEALTNVNFAALPIVRDPSAKDYDWQDYGKSHKSGYGPMGDLGDLVGLVEDYPETIAEMLFEYGFSEEDILEHLYKEKNILDNRVWDYVLSDEEYWERISS